jgi:hypothetical protein
MNIKPAYVVVALAMAGCVQGTPFEPPAGEPASVAAYLVFVDGPGDTLRLYPNGVYEARQYLAPTATVGGFGTVALWTVGTYKIEPGGLYCARPNRYTGEPHCGGQMRDGRLLDYLSVFLWDKTPRTWTNTGGR